MLGRDRGMEMDNNKGNTLRAMTEAWKAARPDVDTSSKATIYAIYLLEKGLRRNAERTLREFGMRYGEYQILTLLRREGLSHRKSSGVIAELLDLTSGAVSQTLNKLEKKGLVSRNTMEADNRQVIVLLTDKGFSIVDRAFEKVTEHENAMLAQMDNSEKNQLQSSLELLMRRMRID